MSYQRFFCPQCGFAIQGFSVEVGHNGYHMQATCPQCHGNVQGVVELPIVEDDEMIPLTLLES